MPESQRTDRRQIVLGTLAHSTGSLDTVAMPHDFQPDGPVLGYTTDDQDIEEETRPRDQDDFGDARPDVSTVPPVRAVLSRRLSIKGDFGTILP